MADINWTKLLQDVPGVQAEFQDESTRDHKSRQNLLNLGILTPEDYAKYWYNSMGGSSLYQQAPPETPAVPPPTSNPASPIGGNRDSALARAKLQAQLYLTSRGLDPSQFPEMDNYFQSIYGTIPEGDTNAQSYFDPNIAQSFVSGRENQMRSQARSMVNSSFGAPSLNYSSLDATISKLLGESVQQGEDYLQRGLKRGQFNEIGYDAGENKLQSAKAKAIAKLQGYANDIYNSYQGKFGDIYSQALSAANNASFNSPFDISPYSAQYNRLTSQLSGPAFEGQLMSLVGDEPLIDLSSLRQGVAAGQGSQNLRNLDVLEGLDKRKRASEVGRGLGSEGAF